MVELLLLIAGAYVLVKVAKKEPTSSDTSQPSTNSNAIPQGLILGLHNPIRSLPFWSDNGGIVTSPANVGSSGTGVSILNQGNPLAATPSTQTSGGGSTSTGFVTTTPTGGSSCFTPEVKVKVNNGLILSFEEIERYIGSESFLVKTLRGWRMAKLIVHERYPRVVLRFGKDSRCTLEHLFFNGSEWVKAYDLFKPDLQIWCGKLYNIHVETEDVFEQNYELADGWVAHNSKATPL